VFGQAYPLDVGFLLCGVVGQALHESHRSIRVRGIFEGRYQLVEVVCIGGGGYDLGLWLDSRGLRIGDAYLLHRASVVIVLGGLSRHGGKQELQSDAADRVPNQQYHDMKLQKS